MSALRYDPSIKSIITVNQHVIAFVNSSDPTLGPAMAAAVEMRDALRGLIDKWDPGLDDPFWNAARAALARADGGLEWPYI